MLRLLPKLLMPGVLALALPLAALANTAVVSSMRGDVKAGPSAQVLVEARQNQRLYGGTTVTTGVNSEATLQFEDGQRVTLGQNTEFRIVDYRYDGQARNDRAIFDMLRGALRVVTGAIARRNRVAWSLRTPTVTIGVRGTDFVVAHVNPTYVNVVQGAIAVSNSAGTVVFPTGSIASIASSTTLAVSVPGTALPQTATVAMADLGATPGAGAPAGSVTFGAEAAGGAATTAVSTTTVTAIGAAIAGVAIIAGDDKPATTHHK
jgi:hypothetical protein